MNEIIQRFEENHRKFVEKVKEQPASIGAQLLNAGQYAEFEAYAGVFGEAFGQLYKGALDRVNFDVAKQCRANIQQTELNPIVEEFKAKFKAILSSLVELPFFEAVCITREVQEVEVRLVREFIGKKERRYRLSQFPIDDEGNFCAPDGTHILRLSKRFVVGFEEIEK